MLNTQRLRDVNEDEMVTLCGPKLCSYNSDSEIDRLVFQDLLDRNVWLWVIQFNLSLTFEHYLIK